MADITHEPINKIAVFRALRLGDVLVAIPALRALRAAFPRAHIDYIGLPMTRELVQRYTSYIDGYIDFPGYPPLPQQEADPARVVEFLQRMQAGTYDLAIQMHGNGSSTNALVALFGARRTAGYAIPEGYWPNRQWFMAHPEGQPEILQHLALMEFLGIKNQGEKLEFPMSDEDQRRLKALFNPQSQPYACIHPGAFSNARWPAEQFSVVADRLAETGLTIVLTGSEQERGLTGQVAAGMKSDAIDLAGKTDLGTLAALLRHSRLLVSNDTGVAHMAVATDTPSVTIFTTADPAVWAALDQQRHPYLTLDWATPTTVLNKATELLKGAHHE
ncbi:glycosyltransferase family 9 protein [Candidatus Saccharibacteria bacterium]|nr:glycosyltransferase family 9 protein [Candidatus Saccharibacteria bacterium]